MTPQEKAKQLFEQFISLDAKCTSGFMSNELAKECAKIAAENEYNNEINKLLNFKNLGYISDDIHAELLAVVIVEKYKALTEIENI